MESLYKQILSDMEKTTLKEGVKKALDKAYKEGIKFSLSSSSSASPLSSSSSPPPTVSPPAGKKPAKSYASAAATAAKPTPTPKKARQPVILVSQKSVAIQPPADFTPTELKETIAKLTALRIQGVKGLRTLPSGRVEVVFNSSEAAEKAKESPA